MARPFRALEHALLLSTPLPADLPATPATALAQLVLDADFEQALGHPLAKQVLTLASPADPSSSTEHGELDVTRRLAPLPSEASSEEELARLLVAVTLLQAFVQVNYTGPSLPSSLSATSLFPEGTFSDEVTPGDIDQLSIESLSYLGEPAYHLAAQPSFLHLAVALLSGPWAHLESGAWWALRAERVWHRLLMTDSPLPLRDGLYEAAAQTLEAPFLDLTEASSPAERSTTQDLRAALAVELGLARHLLLGEDKPALELFERATEESEMRYELTGALGKRTKWQEKEASQLVVLAKSRERAGWTPKITNAPERKVQEDGAKEVVDQNGIPETLRLNDDTLLEQTAFADNAISAEDHPEGSLAREIDPRSPPVLHPLDQALLLALPLIHHSSQGAATSELSISQLAPYTALALTHAQNWSIHTYGLLLRSRSEAGRTRTVERSVLQLQALVDQIPLNDSPTSPGIAPVKERLRYLWQIDLPSKWELEAELAERLVSLGVFRSAEEIYRRLEMWDMVVRCYQHLEEQDRAIQIVTSLLSGTLTEATLTTENARKGEAARSEQSKVRMSVARRANLLCMLGDMTEDVEVDGKRAKYEQAWEESKQTSSRAARSLAGYHFARDNYAEAIPFFEAALAINPLFARSWFILGCAYVKTENWKEAVRAFRRCTGIEEENSEAWNNLASCYLRMPDIGGIDGLKKVAAGIELADLDDQEKVEPEEEVTKPEEGRIPHANKLLAFRALQIGLKYAFSNWRMWSNLAMVAVDLGENTEACRALTRVVEERADVDGEGCIDIEVLDRLVASVTRAPAPGSEEEKALEEQQEKDGVQVAFTSNHGKGLETYVTRLLEVAILPRISSSARIYKAHAKLLLWRGRVADALDAHVKAYRASVVNDEDVERECVRWREAVEEVQEVVDMLVGLGPRAVEDEQGRLEESKKDGGEEVKLVWKDWKFQARSIVRTFMGRTKDAFEDEPEWDKLKDALEEIKNA